MLSHWRFERPEEKVMQTIGPCQCQKYTGSDTWSQTLWHFMTHIYPPVKPAALSIRSQSLSNTFNTFWLQISHIWTWLRSTNAVQYVNSACAVCMHVVGRPLIDRRLFLFFHSFVFFHVLLLGCGGVMTSILLATVSHFFIIKTRVLQHHVETSFLPRTCLCQLYTPSQFSNSNWGRTQNMGRGDCL